MINFSGIHVVRYSSDYISMWDMFLLSSRNSLFFHKRSFLEYHEKKFNDHSLLIFRNSNLIAVFPANECNDEIFSHQGITYGGLLYSSSLKSLEILFILDLISDYYTALGFRKLYYFPVPFPFCRYPSQDDLYWLFRVNAKLYSREISSILPLSIPCRISTLRQRKVRRAKSLELKFNRICNLEQFYQILSSTLSRHSTKPVHNLSELSFLLTQFPENLIPYGVFAGPDLLAGSLVFDFGGIVHTQYLASSNEGRQNGALDYLICCLIETFSTSHQYLSFGSSCESFGSVVNAGLLFQKEGFGARSISLDKYSLALPSPPVIQM